MKKVLLVNGVPASGKSSTAESIARHLEIPLFSLDTIKEPFFSELGVADREYNRKLGRAAYGAIFKTLADFPEGTTAIVEAWFGFQPKKILLHHLESAGVEKTVEFWCHAPADTICDRYAKRINTRPAGHPGKDYIEELKILASSAKPLSFSPVQSVDTTRPINFSEICSFLAKHGFEAVAARMQHRF